MHPENGTLASAEAQLSAGSSRARVHSPTGLPRASEVARWNLRIVVLFGIIDGMDIALLPATFRALEATFGLTTSNLATMAAAQGFGMAVGAPIWGAFADNGASLKLLMAIGASSWACILMLLSFTSVFQIMVSLRFFNGVALSVYAPVIQCIVAESTEQHERGTEFGRIEFFRHCIGNFGAMLVCTAISNTTIFGMMGWRVAFIGVAISAMLLTAVILSSFQEEPREWKPDQISIQKEFSKLYGFLCIGSYRVILIQGMFQEMCFGAMQFLPMYFQYLGLPDAQAGLAAAMYQFSRGMGYFWGGSIGDSLSKWSPYHGRTFAAQLSCLLSVPLAWVLFNLIDDRLFPTVVIVFLLGLISVWPKTACNKPVLIDVVPDGCVSAATAWDRTIEGGVGHTIGPHAVGVLSAAAFGYNPASVQLEALSPEDQAINMRALGSSLFLVLLVGKLCCCLFYGFLHWTYKQDMQQANNKYSAKLLDMKLPTEATPLKATKDTKEV